MAIGEKISDAEISMILDTYMYLDYKEAREGLTINEILKELKEHPDYGGGGIHHGEYTVLEQAAENPEIGEMVMCCQSGNMGYDSGTAACTFKSPGENSYYMVYRGTGDGEWPDNGIGMTSSATMQQERALSWFEEVVETLELGEQDHLVVTGHSKGGNKAQFVTMETRYDSLVDVCYSVDGQGFSESAISRWQERYGEEEYEKRREKLYGIHGENDYVSVLGNSVIPQNHIRYVKTPVEKSNFAGYHDIKYMFAALVYDKAAKSYVTAFSGRKNDDVKGQGELGSYAAALSAQVMELEPDKRDGCAGVIMQMMEAFGGERKRGLNGEKLTLSDLKDFTFQGLPLIAGSLFKGEEGKKLLQALIRKDSFSGGLSGSLNLWADPVMLKKQAQNAENLSVSLKKITEEIRGMADGIPLYMKGHDAIYHSIKLSAAELDRNSKELTNMAGYVRRAAESYEKWNEKQR